MTLPTFLGIGAPRAGTTWLHELLASHPDVYVPTRRKEVRFFHRYYERGLQWYQEFFPSEAEQYRAIGEISPGYLYCPECPERIARLSSINKLILILRNPVDRAYSDYGFQVRYENYSGSFEDLLRFMPRLIDWGYYSRYLINYLRFFRRDQVLVLIFERAVAEVSETKGTLARFLDVSADRFPAGAGTKKVHKSYIPKARFAYTFSMKVADILWDRDLDWVVNCARRVGINARLFGEAGSLPPMTDETRKCIGELYANEIQELESLLQVDLQCWREFRVVA